MKKVAEFIEGTFIDYKGDKREYTICALSCPIEEGDDKLGLSNLTNNIKAKLYGQDHAIEEITDKIMMSRAGLNEPGKPHGAFLLAGPSGVMTNLQDNRDGNRPSWMTAASLNRPARHNSLAHRNTNAPAPSWARCSEPIGAPTRRATVRFFRHRPSRAY